MDCFNWYFIDTKYLIKFLNLWYVAWMVKQGNSDFSSCNWRIVGRNSVRNFLIKSKAEAVKEATRGQKSRLWVTFLIPYLRTSLFLRREYC
ncbi:hypothetical protein QL285_051221 [Trifolium repens]|nr:hypothetical protein QL285_051221 [Trifolium repens]